MKFYDCKKANIYDTNNVLLCEAAVTDITENSAILTIPEALGDILRTEVLVTFFDSQRGLVTCFCALSDYKEFFTEDGGKSCSVYCAIGQESEALDRRRDLKVPVDISVRVHFKESDSKTNTAEIRILDISAGGLFCVSKHHWDIGQTFIFPFWEGNFSLTAEILRQQDPQTYNPKLSDDSLYGYGCRFIELLGASESTLRGFIYRKDLQRNRAKK